MANPFVKIKNAFSNFFGYLKDGNAAVKLSLLIMGLGCMANGQLIKGLIFLATEIIFFIFLFSFGLNYLRDFGTLGTATQLKVFNETTQIYDYLPGDNSLLILLFSVLSIITVVFFLYLYVKNVKVGYEAYKIKQMGGTPPSFKEDLKTLTGKNFHITLMLLPTLGLLAFTILPLVFNFLMAFTNFDRNHQPPGNLFTWVGTINFKNLFGQNASQSQTFIGVFKWTITWAVIATFSNYILGMILAMLINKKGIKFKGFWRTIFVITIAVPQFVTLMLMARILHDMGPLNVLLQNANIISEPIKFLTDPKLARISILVVNVWVGVPYTMLITTGILMNIPEDLYESARIDGANAVKMFTKITLPYMFFVTTPYLITQFTGNINNFNVIYLLTGGGPLTLDYYQAGHTDLLVTWLYKLTVNEQNYSLAAVIGVVIFIILSILSLVLYNVSGSTRREEEFQ